MPRIADPTLNHILAGRTPSSVEFAYLAGIMDGEGYFAASARSNSFGLRVSMLERITPEWLVERFGGKLYPIKTISGRGAWVWYLQRQADLRFVLNGMLPYLVLKAPRAEAMLVLLDHLAAQPVYATPTRECSRRERDERRDTRAAWSARTKVLRASIAASNFAVT